MCGFSGLAYHSESPGARLQDVVIDDDELLGLLRGAAPPRHQRPTLLPEPELYCGHQTDASLDIKFHECFKWKLLILLHFPANDEMSMSTLHI